MIKNKNSTEIIKLNELENGQEGTIVSYNDEGDAELKRHLLGMGFVKGSKIILEKVAPLGDPIKLRLKGYSICLRKNEAKNIEVKISN
ncbi:MAG: ferrous iron transport protein A [Methanobrevibacter sp.]|jgi:ferrous iron transport protein A|nr:ferrous iron transport protein A [Methanobrevibacter sp.]